MIRFTLYGALQRFTKIFVKRMANRFTRYTPLYRGVT